MESLTISSSLTPNEARPISCENLDNEKKEIWFFKYYPIFTGQNLGLIEAEHDQEVHEQHLKVEGRFEEGINFFSPSNLVQVNEVVMMDDEYIAYIEILEMPN